MKDSPQKQSENNSSSYHKDESDSIDQDFDGPIVIDRNQIGRKYVMDNGNYLMAHQSLHFSKHSAESACTQKYLIVNDEPFQLMMMQETMAQLKHVNVMTAINGDLAVRTI